LEKHKLYNFGAFQIDAEKCRLWHGEDLVPLTPKEFEVLFYLVEHSGQIAEKGDLLDTIWEDTFVEEATLARNVSWLRKKLAEFAPDEQFIETVPKLGYRFSAEVEWVENDENVLIIEEQTIQHFRSEESITISDDYLQKSLPQKKNSDLSESKFKIRILKLAVISLGLILTVGFGFILYQNDFKDKEIKAVVAKKIAPFSGIKGREDGPAFSPDGKQLAFSWNGGEGTNNNIYVRLLNSEKPLQLTDSETNDRYPTFSPDGTEIAFLREYKTHGELIVIPALGGTERKIQRLFSGNYSISYSSTGDEIAVIDTENSKSGGQYAIYLINSQTLERRRLTQKTDFTGETTPRFSPDGKSLAFVRIYGSSKQDLFVVPASGGKPRQITTDGVVIHSLTWSADGKMIYFVSFREANQPRLWRISAEGGKPEIVTVGGENISNVAMSPNNKTIAFVDNFNHWSIWKITQDGQPAQRFISANGRDVSAKFSPDGTRILFSSDRMGSADIWTVDANGNNLRRITDSTKEISEPRWSFDGSQIVFQRHDGDKPGIDVVSSEGGKIKHILTDTSRFIFPTFSADGNWIYFTSKRSGEYQIWKIRSDGSGEPKQITRKGGMLSQPTFDGKTLYFTKSQASGGIWRMSIDGGIEEKVQEITDAGFSNQFVNKRDEYGNQWTVKENGIYFLARSSDNTYKLKFYDFNSEQIKDLELEQEILQNIDTQFGMATDGESFLFSVRDPILSNIFLAELS
jgi:Tol biopolymer transport system component/DNA-binding winged helix-turn-helix (wHTH) protein